MPEQALRRCVGDAAPIPVQAQEQLRFGIGVQAEREDRLLVEPESSSRAGDAQLRQLRIESLRIEHEHGVEERASGGEAADALDVDQRRVLEGPQLDLLLAEQRQPVRHSRVTRDVYAQRQRVDEHADDRIGVGDTRAPAGAHAAVHDVLFAAIARDEQCPRTLDDRVHRHAALRGKFTQPRRRGARQAHLDLVAITLLSDRAGFRRRELQRVGIPETVQTRPPEGVVAARVALAQPVDVLAEGARRCELQLAPGAQRVVAREDVLQHGGEGASVEQHVMERPDQRPRALRALDPGESHHRSTREVERPGAIGLEPLLRARRMSVERELAPIEHREVEGDRLVHLLQRLGKSFPAKRRAQSAMARDRLAPGFLQRLARERLVELAHDLLDVDAGVSTRQMVEQHPLLHRGQGKCVGDGHRGAGCAARHATQRRRRVPRKPRAFHRGGGCANAVGAPSLER